MQRCVYINRGMVIQIPRPGAVTTTEKGFSPRGDGACGRGHTHSVFLDVAPPETIAAVARRVVIAMHRYFESQRAWPAPTIINADLRFMSYPFDIWFSKEVTL